MNDMVEFNREELPEEEEQTVDSTEEEPIEGQDEELAEGTEGEEDSQEWEEIPGDTIFPVPYVNQYGEEETLEVTYDEIVSAVGQVKSGVIAEKDEFINSAMPIINRMVKSGIARAIDQYLTMGYTDEQLVRMMPDVIKGVMPGQPAKAPADPNDPIAMIRDVVREEVTPLKAQFETTAQQQARQAIVKNNDDMLTNAFSRYDIDPKSLKSEDLRVLQKTLQDMYPHTNFENIRLTQQQAYIIVNDAVPKMKAKGVKKTGNIQGALKQAKAPSVLPGRETSGLRPKKASMPNTKGATVDDRRASWLNLINQ